MGEAGLDRSDLGRMVGRPLPVPAAGTAPQPPAQLYLDAQTLWRATTARSGKSRARHRRDSQLSEKPERPHSSSVTREHTGLWLSQRGGISGPTVRRLLRSRGSGNTEITEIEGRRRMVEITPFGVLTVVTLCVGAIGVIVLAVL